jgi:hypothetical protein
MNVLWSAVPALLLLVATLTVLGAWSRAADSLAQARVLWVLGGAFLYSAGFFVFNGVWAWLLSLSAFPAASGQVQPGSRLRAFFVGLLSLAGLLTPMNLGTDVLRSTLGKRYLGAAVDRSAAASIVTREWKLHSTLVLLPVATAAVAASGEQRLPIVVALGGLLVVAVLLAAFRSRAVGGLARAVRADGVAEAARHLTRRVPLRSRVPVLVLFAAGFVAEWSALRLCFAALDLGPGVTVTLTAYGLFYFLSRTPVLPLGIGVVESAGFAWFRLADVPAEQAGALVVLWSGIRVAVPHLLSAAGLMALLGLGRRARTPD